MISFINGVILVGFSGLIGIKVFVGVFCFVGIVFVMVFRVYCVGWSFIVKFQIGGI